MNVVTATPIGGGSYKWLVLFNVMLTTFMAVLDSTVVNTGLPVIMGTLGASMNSAEWILTGYMLSMATILPAAGWLSDRFGYKRIFVFSLMVFTVGSFMCGNSTAIGGTGILAYISGHRGWFVDARGDGCGNDRFPRGAAGNGSRFLGDSLGSFSLLWSAYRWLSRG